MTTLDRTERLVEVMKWSGCDKSRLMKIANRISASEIGNTWIADDDPIRAVSAAVEQMRLAYARDMRKDDNDSALNYLAEAKRQTIESIENGKWLPSSLLTIEGAAKEAALFKGGIEDPF